jgi:hypothetical protein
MTMAIALAIAEVPDGAKAAGLAAGGIGLLLRSRRRQVQGHSSMPPWWQHSPSRPHRYAASRSRIGATFASFGTLSGATRPKTRNRYGIDLGRLRLAKDNPAFRLRSLIRQSLGLEITTSRIFLDLS